MVYPTSTTTTTTTIAPSTTTTTSTSTTTTTTLQPDYIEYRLSTTTRASADYIDTNGQPVWVEIGGASGYDMTRFCALADSVICYGDYQISALGPC